MGDLDVWKYRAYVIPAVGKPIAAGDLAQVLSSVTKLLRDHPSYKVAVRSVSHGSRRDSAHSIHIARSVTGGLRVDARPGGGRPTDTKRMVQDLAEVRTVLSNLGHPTPDPQEF